MTPRASGGRSEQANQILVLVSQAPDETRRLGEALGRETRPGDVLLLDGPFGAGKTALVQGVAAGLGVAGHVGSPSFIMINEHHGRLPLYHVDLYRLEHELDPETLEALEEYFGGDGVCAVEWPSLVPLHLRAGATEIRFEVEGETCRRITLSTPHAHLAAAARAAGATG
jgi:tRNA threonylcarbamoyladenosine biosynthesis protein TsaE